jgi:hypothetical protein
MSYEGVNTTLLLARKTAPRRSPQGWHGGAESPRPPAPLHLLSLPCRRRCDCSRRRPSGPCGLLAMVAEGVLGAEAGGLVLGRAGLIRAMRARSGPGGPEPSRGHGRRPAWCSAVLLASGFLAVRMEAAAAEPMPGAVGRGGAPDGVRLVVSGLHLWCRRSRRRRGCRGGGPGCACFLVAAAA